MYIAAIMFEQTKHAVTNSKANIYQYNTLHVSMSIEHKIGRRLILLFP